MPAPYYVDDLVTLHLGDCRDVMAAMADASVDAIVTDPPYELGFMGRHWDASGVACDVGLWRECLRLLKPGGHLLAFGGTRTYHRMTCAIEDAGFEIRDSLHWMYGSGFPKSLDVSKAIDKAAGAAREVVGRKSDPRYQHAFNGTASSPMGNVDPRRARADHGDLTAPATEAAARWEGWGTALKPAHEPIVVARKPLAGTVAGNVLQYGTGALNIDGCRVEGVPPSVPQWHSAGSNNNWAAEGRNGQMSQPHDAGRWPPNILLTHSAECNGDCAPGCPAAGLDAQSGTSKSSGGRIGNKDGGHIYGGGKGLAGVFAPGDPGFGDVGGASRFFPVLNWDAEYDPPFLYCAKAPKSERPTAEGISAHPTVKPLAVMRWLVRLVTPPGGLVLDPFAGTGTTGQACALEGFRCVLAEQDPASAELSRIRLSKPVQQQITPCETA